MYLYTKAGCDMSANWEANVPMPSSDGFKVGAAQADPRLESTNRFQTLIVKKDTQCFQLEPGFLSLHPGFKGRQKYGRCAVGRCRLTHQVDPGLKALGFNQLKVHPFQSFGFRCQPAPLHHGVAFIVALCFSITFSGW